MFLYHPGDIIQGEDIHLIVETCVKANHCGSIVPGYQFGIIISVASQRAGRVNIRLIANEMVDRYIGHIGFRVSENFRGNQYAYRAVLLVREVLAKHAIDPAIITCNTDNAASIKTINKIGATYVETVRVPVDKQQAADGASKRRYLWRTLSTT